MVIGVGTDLVEIHRIKRACERDSFVAYTFTEEERRQAGESVSRLAGDFAVKEAVVKAFGTGFGSIRPGDIEVLRDVSGKPYVNLSGKAKEFADSRGIDNIQVSISDTGELVLAFAVAEASDK